MRKSRITGIATALLLSVVIYSCHKEEASDPGPTPYVLAIPLGLPAMQIPASNPLTVEGIALGRKLFYDPILSGNNTQSCGGCHRQEFAFSDSLLVFSIGIDHVPGVRNGMPLFNLGYQKKFFWDGGAADLESQVIGPIQNPVEMHETLPNALSELKAHPDYPALFKKAFGTNEITIPLVMKPLAQFERTMVSGNTKFDQFRNGTVTLTPQEMHGMQVYQDPNKGDCVHCHSMGSTFSDFEFRNTGLDSIYKDAGRYLITLLPSDSGKFKTPSLRNITLTAPYMHDGRFTTLQQCLDHYNTGFHYSANLDGSLVHLPKGRMSAQDMQDVIVFLNTLTDVSFTQNPDFKKP